GKVLIRPQIGSLEAVEGYVPTVRGTVRVGVRQTPGVRYAVTVEVPVNTTARVELPWRGGMTLLMDGKAVAARVAGGRFVVDGVSSGRHTLSWQRGEEAACGSSFGGRVRKIVGCGWRSWVPFF
ncbi:MAG TPA: alpha-L-rhamnosidase C-terminal domain-containing protein, partial [Kiritimatiellia bacterium]|nr:alpha-L-rhamnosidase C-terminal domain-containing protein [Kiritimatiellia bacterium]